MIGRTASKTALLLQCSRPFSQGVETHDEPHEASRFGTGCHLCLETWVRRGAAVMMGPDGPLGITTHGTMDGDAVLPARIKEVYPEDPSAVFTHSLSAYAALNTWIKRERLRVVYAEKHLAARLRRGRPPEVRECGFDVESHRYDTRPDEQLAGTPDLLLEDPRGRVVVLDHKFGDWGDFSSPSTLPQMLTLGLLTGADEAAVLHHPRGGVPVVYCDPFPEGAIEGHERTLRRALRRVDDGSLRPGPECRWCPARGSCPANDGELLARTSSLVRTTSEGALAKPVDPGHLHQLLGELDRLTRRAREVLRAEVRGGAVIVRPDGKVLVMREKRYETISKSSVLEALGPRKGEELLAKLRAAGAVRDDVREELHAVEDR